MKTLRILDRYLENFITRRYVTPFIRAKTGDMVASGLFKGMKYVEGSVGSRLLPKYLGTYELELVPILEKVLRESFNTIIDVGAAEGYYAVGMAMRSPSAEVIAFESEERGRDLIKKMAESNGVSGRVSTKGFCDTKSLSDTIAENKKTLVMMDIEGGEKELLDNSLISKLNKCYILVEAHECVVPGIVDTLVARFKDTHKFMETKERRRIPEDFPISIPLIYRTLFKKYFVTSSMNEARYDSLLPWPEKNAGWLYFEPK
ncbi:MAG: hypothetical protein Q7S19_00820 [bacterium]|nr:hypothetical protein [bacterium]